MVCVGIAWEWTCVLVRVCVCVCVRAGAVPDGEVKTKLSVTLPDSTWRFPEVGGG